mmetsp:Transcript_2784/g.8576  ORF Transcript_2784/g.8576 Transcript_2784/m.8576 type:complete len:517 (-) Transcript_2784:92-1642(-)
MTPHRKRVAVIGGGISGLAAAKAFRAKGHEVVIFEQSDGLGGVWRETYPDVKTQSPKELYAFTDEPYPASVPEQPSGDDVRAYLEAYAVKHDLVGATRLNTEVKALRRDGDAWLVTSGPTSGGAAVNELFDAVAICTGLHSKPRMPTVCGEFAGAVLHSSEVTEASLTGKNIVVVGGSKSGTDIAVAASRRTPHAVTWVRRRDVWRVPYHILGVNFKRLLYPRAQEILIPSPWRQSGLGRVVRWLIAPIVWLHFKMLETIITLQCGLARRGLIPTTNVADVVACDLPMVTDGFYEALDAGSVVAAKGEIARFEPEAVVLTGGERVPCDTVIFATGWHQTADALFAEADRSAIVGSDGLYCLHRHVVSPDVKNLGFVGSSSSFASVLTSELAAEWLVRYLDGQLARQPTDADMRRSIADQVAWRHERPAAKSFGGRCVAPFHFRYADAILDDIGAKVTPFNTSWLLPPDAVAIGKLLASAPAYVVTDDEGKPLASVVSSDKCSAASRKPLAATVTPN